MGNRRARPGWHPSRYVAAVLPLALIATACGGDGRDDGAVPTSQQVETPEDVTAASPSTLSPCSAARYLVAFDVFGTLSLADQDLVDWLGDPSNEPEPRPGAAEVVSAYRSLGYEIWYVTTVPVQLSIGDQPFEDALRGWLERHWLPIGQGTSIHTWAGGGDDMLSIVDGLLRFSGEGVTADAGYTDNQDKAEALMTGGIPPERTFTLGSGAGTRGSTAIPAGDMFAHVATVQGLGKVCEPG
jgi:hypothetical protein